MGWVRRALCAFDSRALRGAGAPLHSMALSCLRVNSARARGRPTSRPMRRARRRERLLARPRARLPLAGCKVKPLLGT